MEAGRAARHGFGSNPYLRIRVTKLLAADLEQARRTGLISMRALQRVYEQRVLLLPERQIVDDGSRGGVGICARVRHGRVRQQAAQFGRADGLFATEHQ